MAIILHDLAGADGRRFSPFCWRAKMALAHKGLAFETRATPFTGIKAIGGGTEKTVPVIEDRGRVVRDSFDIALYLEETYPDRPTLFGGDGGKAMARFIESWANATLGAQIVTLCVKDIHDCLSEEDKGYFRESREKRFGRALEAVQEGRESRVEAARQALMPLRLMLRRQPFIGGEGPLFADYIVFGSLQWPRVVSSFPILAEDDPVREWFERCLDLFDGLGRDMPAAA